VLSPPIIACKKSVLARAESRDALRFSALWLLATDHGILWRPEDKSDMSFGKKGYLEGYFASS
jgi:hypothetical protein